MSDNKKNLVQFSGKFTPEMAREYGRRGGKASGESRRRKAAFRDIFNTLLTDEIDNEEWKPILEARGLPCTLEAIIAMAMAKEAMMGNVKAFEAIAKYTGQSDKTERDEEEQDIRIARARNARDMELGGESIDANENIQSFLKAMQPSEEDLNELLQEEEEEDDAEEETEETGEV